ncbi:MAG: PEP-CTERM sorting domain-containing protein [Planctomycetota bacterium]|jgi:hypothetical protein
MIKKAEILIILFVVFCLWTGSLRAELIAIDLTAEVIYISDLADLLEGKVHVGDIITGSYSYDSDTPDSSPSSSLGTYRHYTPPYGINLSVGGFVFQTDPDNVDFILQVSNNNIPSWVDNYVLRSYHNLPLSNWVEVDHISWQLNDYSGAALSSDALPIIPPVLGDWENNYLLISLGYLGESGIQARVTSAVPEPATVLLLTLGSLLLTRRRR